MITGETVQRNTAPERLQLRPCGGVIYNPSWQGESNDLAPRDARDSVARSWRWSCHRATIPRHRGTGPEAYLIRTSRGGHPTTPGVRLGKTGQRRRQGCLRRKAHPEPLPSLAHRKASRAFHENPAKRPSLSLHYQRRDHTPWRDANAALPASGGADHPCLAPSEQSLPLREKDGQSGGRSRCFLHSSA
jgi:hypothetical protein